MFKEVNKHLMWQLDRLSSISDEDLKDQIESEVKRASAICDVVRQTVEVGRTVIEAHRISGEYNIKPETLGLGHEDDK